MALLVLAALCGGGYASLRARDRTLEDRERGAAAAALTTYLKRVQAGDYRSAYAQLCIDVLYNYSESDHEQFLRSQPAYSSFELGSGRERSGRDGTYVDFPVKLRNVSGADSAFVLEVGVQTHGPKICDAPDRRSPT